MEAEAKRIEELPLPRCMYRKYKNVRYWWTVIPMLIVLIILLSWVAIVQESRKRWITQAFRVQFSAVRNPSLVPYNGCYNIDLDRKKTWENKLFNKRSYYDSYEANTASATFGYCDVRTGRTASIYVYIAAVSPFPPVPVTLRTRGLTPKFRS